mmetsp:Transcript_10070/g.23212  ORF Transcript_10070/g.23212 Transcript_10070/m.23212 type:complete len:139 (-) Transcript_10070:153-569(-)
MLRRLGSTGASLTAVAAWTWTRPRLGSETECQQSGGVHALGRTCRVREPGQDFPVAAHHHGKAKVRVLKVRHDASGGAAGGEKHSVSEYTVHTRLYSPEYEKVTSVGCWQPWRAMPRTSQHGGPRSSVVVESSSALYS